MKSLLVYVFCSVLFVILLPFTSGERCNKVVCASVVSKCLLTKACMCDISMDHKRCSCCVDCAKCLGHHFLKCCSCLKMCSADSLPLDPKDSEIGDLHNPFVELFDAVTQAKDPLVEDIVLTYPADLALDDLAKRLKKHDDGNKECDRNDHLPPFPRMGINCTVVYLSKCRSASKCKQHCITIGAGSYRYFFNGCCECIGLSCLDYGINESRCQKCSKYDDEHLDIQYYSDDPY